MRETPETTSNPQAVVHSHKDTLQHMEDLFSSGFSFEKIADELNRIGCARMNGNQFDSKAVFVYFNRKTAPKTAAHKRTRGNCPKVIEMVTEMLATGFDHARIANALNSHGYVTKDKSRWKANDIAALERKLNSLQESHPKAYHAQGERIEPKLNRFQKCHPKAYHAEGERKFIAGVRHDLNVQKDEVRPSFSEPVKQVERDASITEDVFTQTLNKAARMAYRKFKNCVPFGMSQEDFMQEIFLRMMRECARWRNIGKVSFEKYVGSTALNRARDILRSDEVKNSVAVSDNEIRAKALALELNPDELTDKQRKHIRCILRQHLVEFHGDFHHEPTLSERTKGRFSSDEMVDEENDFEYEKAAS